uniref:Uncharacterized protein n=1 Tax=Arundo donax TaxID=35708 RepID=A0A0A9ECN5_ARUDO
MVQSRGSSRFDDDGAYSFRPHGGAWTGGSRCAGAVKKEQTAWRPGGSWARGSRGGNGGAAGRGGSGQPRGW